VAARVPWVRFTRAFDWSPPERGGLTTIAFAAGSTVCVRIACAAAAVAEGAAVRTGRPANDRPQRGEGVSDGDGDQKRG
jgi:hypothetical protein